MLSRKRAMSLFTIAAVVLVSTFLIAASSVNNTKWQGNVDVTLDSTVFSDNLIVTETDHSFSVRNKTNAQANFTFEYTQRVLVKAGPNHWVDVPGENLLKIVAGSFAVEPGQTYTSQMHAQDNPAENGHLSQDFFGVEGEQYRLKGQTIVTPLGTGFGDPISIIRREDIDF